MPEVSSSSFSETDASNNSAAPNGFPENMAMSGLNDSGRAVMGAVKRMWTRLNGAYASTGSANGYVVTPSVALGAYVTGERYSWRANHTNTGTATGNISGLGAKTIKKMTSAGKTNLAAGDIMPSQPVTVEYDGTDLILCTPIANAIDINGLTEDTSPDPTADYAPTYDASAGTSKKVLLKSFGRAVQFASTQNGTVATGTTTIPADDTIPQNTEGTEFLNLSITPKATTNKLKIEVTMMLSHSAANSTLVAALFQDSTANALALGFEQEVTATFVKCITFSHVMDAGTTSATTFKVRAGSNQTGTTTMNGQSGSRLFGGVSISSIRITEYVP